MKLFLVSQNVNNDYDTYDSFVVACKNEDEARHTSPSGDFKWKDGGWYFLRTDGTEVFYGEDANWCHPKDVTVTYFGKADKGVSGVICASFNAG